MRMTIERLLKHPFTSTKKTDSQQTEIINISLAFRILGWLMRQLYIQGDKAARRFSPVFAKVSHANTPNLTISDKFQNLTI